MQKWSVALCMRVGVSCWLNKKTACGDGVEQLLEGLDFHVFFDAAADALVLADDAGKVALANPAASELFGYKREEMPGMAVEALIPERFRENHRRYRDMFLHHPEKRAMGNGKELLGLARDGRELMVDIGLSPLRWDGRSYVLITFFDATRRRQATQALQESEERCGLPSERPGWGIFDHDLVSGTTRSTSARAIYGASRGMKTSPSNRPWHMSILPIAKPGKPL